MIVKSVLLLVVVGSFAKGELITKSLYAGSLNITCAVHNMTSLALGIQNPTSFVISKLHDDGGSVNVASASFSGSAADNFTGAEVWFDMDISSPYHFLTLQWNQPSSNESVFVDGPWLCELFGLGIDNRPRSVRQEFNVRIVDLDPLISTTPKHIESGLTQTLVVDCSSGGLALQELSEPFEVKLYHRKDGQEETDDELIVSASTVESEELVGTAQDPWTVVSSYYGPNKTLHMEIFKKDPTVNDAGMYTCNIMAKKAGSNEIVHLVKTANVTASYATKQDIVDRIGTEDEKEYTFHACTFENGPCGFNVTSTYSNGSWQLLQSRAAGQPADHTRQDGSGHYIYARIPEYSKATLKVHSKEFPQITKPFCISFFYHFTDYSSLKVYLIGKSSGSSLITSLQGTSAWRHAKIMLLPTTEAFILEFQFGRPSDYYYSDYYYGNKEITALVDDIVISDINCF